MFLRWLQCNWAYQVKSSEWGDLAGGQYPRVSIANQLISLTEVSCLWHNAHRKNQLAEHTAENCCYNECVYVRAYTCMCVCLFQNISPLFIQWHGMPQVCICFKATWLTHVQYVMTIPHAFVCWVVLLLVRIWKTQTQAFICKKLTLCRF